jgi:hypothetical protein
MTYNKAPALGRMPKAGALDNCSQWWSYQDSVYGQQGNAVFLYGKI